MSLAVRGRLAVGLRRLRLESDKTTKTVAEILGWPTAKVSRYELARRGLKPAEIGRLLDVYGVRDNHRKQLLTLAQEATQRGWWEDSSDVLTEEYLAFISLEAEATAVHQWQVTAVVGCCRPNGTPGMSSRAIRT